MKKLVMLPVIALAVAGMLSITACGDKGGDSGGTTKPKTSALETAIKNAETEQFGVKEAADKSEVVKGVYWVTKAEMTAFNNAIISAKVVRDKPVSQKLVDEELAILKRATENFKAAKQEGDATPVKLKGTITVKYKGASVPYVEITAHSIYWSWSETTRLVSPAENAPWEMTTMAQTQPTEIFFNVAGYADNKYEKPIFSLAVKDLTRELHATDISGITINMGNLNLITLSGTINGSFGGKTVPSVTIEVMKRMSVSHMLAIGSTYVQGVGNNTNTPWSIAIEVLEEETEVFFNICGFGTAYGRDEDAVLFAIYNQDFDVKVKDKDVGNIAITFKPIILSGTINVTYDNKPVPYVMLTAWSQEKWDGATNEGYWDGWLYNTTLKPGAWSMVLPAFDKETSVRFTVDGYTIDNPHQLPDEDRPEFELFGWGNVYELDDLDEKWYPKPAEGAVVKVKDTDISGIHLNLGNIEPPKEDDPEGPEEDDD